MKECIILAGGLGTRLQSVVKDVPKCMAEVAGKPFLYHLFNYARKEAFGHVILSLGYKADVVLEWLENKTFPFQISYVKEEEPLGTGGAIKLAFRQVCGESAYVINGDTFFDINTDVFSDFHSGKNASISLALKPMSDFDRYGSVELNDKERVIRFNEKQYRHKGLINGGVYLINKDIFLSFDLPEKFSFEKDIMEAHLHDIGIYGRDFDNYFIDIGIPSDFEKANIDFSSK
jgi:D-glycero-alpha-D-manno-heptose 1-phosphate guanylyltransferase